MQTLKYRYKSRLFPEQTVHEHEDNFENILRMVKTTKSLEYVLLDTRAIEQRGYYEYEHESTHPQQSK